jgi:hypothetical protein
MASKGISIINPFDQLQVFGHSLLQEEFFKDLLSIEELVSKPVSKPYMPNLQKNIKLTFFL